jgi:hypothetical protein
MSGLSVTGGSAGVQSDLWGERAREWCAMEAQMRPLYETVLERVGVGQGTELLDAGCGAGLAVGFNSFQYAASPRAALEQARRVARAGAPVVIATWAVPERCEAAVYIAALGALMPPPPPDAPGPFALSAPGALEGLAIEAGLAPADAGEVSCPWGFPDSSRRFARCCRRVRRSRRYAPPGKTRRGMRWRRRLSHSAGLRASTRSVRPFATWSRPPEPRVMCLALAAGRRGLGSIMARWATGSPAACSWGAIRS